MMEPLAVGASVGAVFIVVGLLLLLASGGDKYNGKNVGTLLKSSSTQGTDSRRSRGGFLYATTKVEDTPAGFVMTNDWGNLTLFSDVSGRFYRSIDYGDSWAVLADALEGGVLYGAAMSGDGREIMAGTASGGVYYSDDFGESFEKRAKTTCSIIAASADLSQAACVGGAVGEMNNIFFSINSGKKWSKSTMTKQYWAGIASNADASYMVAIVPAKQKYAWVSTDGGASFSVLANNELRTWGCLGHSRDLSRMILTDVGTLNTHGSIDYGQTWFQIYCGDCLTHNFSQPGWASCAVSGDGLSYALGFKDETLKVVHNCDPAVNGTHACKDCWQDQVAASTSGVWDTVGVAFSYDGTYFYSVDALKLVVTTGKYEYDDDAAE